MSGLGGFFAQHGRDLLEGATGTAVFVAIAKHMPDWPLSWQSIYEWFRGSIQEIANQRSGAVTSDVESSRRENSNRAGSSKLEQGPTSAGEGPQAEK